MKKLLSVIIALVMVLSVVPLAFASNDAVAEAYIEEYIKYWSYKNNVYAVYDTYTKIYPLYYEAEGYYSEGLDVGREWMAEKGESLSVVTQKLEKANKEVEEKIEDGTYVVVVDTSEFFGDYYRLFAFNDFDAVVAVIDKVDRDVYDEAMASFTAAAEYIPVAYEDISSASQEDFDAAAEKFVAFVRATKACIEGKHSCKSWTNNEDGSHSGICSFCKYSITEGHIYGEYVPNYDATEEQDGTKTAVCEKCLAEDTVTDEGSKLEKEPMSFIERIIEIFKSIFDRILSLFR